MKAEFWLERWERNEIGFHQDEINVHLQAFWGGLNAPEGGTVFVPLCGKSRDMLWLRAQGHAVLGVEISPLAVADFFRENMLEPTVRDEGAFQRWEADGVTILCGDFFELSPEVTECVHTAFDRASLVALPPDMRPRYARHLTRLLDTGAEVLLVTMEYPPDGMEGPPFPVFEQEVRELYGAAFKIDPLYRRDILRENPRFRERGLTRLEESVYRLHRRA